MQISEKEVTDMYNKTEQLPGLDFYVSQNFDLLSEEDQVRYVLLAEKYLSELTKIASRINTDNKEVMCHEIIFDKTKAFDPYEHKFLKEYPLEITKHTYEPVKISWLGIKVRDLNKWIQVYIPDPNSVITTDMAIEMAVDEAQHYISEEIRKYNEWERIRGDFG